MQKGLNRAPISPVKKEKLKYSHCVKRRHLRALLGHDSHLRPKQRNAIANIVSSEGKETSAAQPQLPDRRDHDLKDLQHQLSALKASSALRHL
ncbi:hypothetical protein AMTR_s00011p00264120 [Amborella trichopoda]|uniref:Uncharacterized protein n=1 Tax=Amborella trichopoda TaxID=13333 RepID=W1NG67_AMBTC|nr:hypothetical protein AMTR_s00011p00264120 [Amborella trichopoda]